MQEGVQFPRRTECQQDVSKIFQKKFFFQMKRHSHLCPLPLLFFYSLEMAGSLADNSKPTKESGLKAKKSHLAPGPVSGRGRQTGRQLLPPQGEGTLVLQLDGCVPLLSQHLRLLQQTLVLFLQLLQAAQVGVVDGNFLAVPLPQGIVVLLDHLQLVHGRVVQLIENL